VDVDGEDRAGRGPDVRPVTGDHRRTGDARPAIAGEAPDLGAGRRVPGDQGAVLDDEPEAAGERGRRVRGVVAKDRAVAASWTLPTVPPLLVELGLKKRPS
jgi:hypothetical protein